MLDRRFTTHEIPSAQEPECWTRLEFAEHRFVASAAEHTDGVVIPLRFDTAVPAVAEAQLPPMQPSALKPAALAARVPFLIDLESWRLPYLTGHDDRTLRRDGATLLALAALLPLDPSALVDDFALVPLVRVALTAQVGAAQLFAPDFQFRALDDPSLAVNLRALTVTRSVAGSRRVGAWIHITFETMVSGILPYVAQRYARELAAGATVVLTVSDMHPTVGPDDLAVYLEALAAFRAAGLRVLVDRAGDACIPAVATYAAGCMLGNRIYRTAPSAPRFESDFNPKVRLAYYVGAQGRRVPRDLAHARHAAGRLPDCEHEGCEAVLATGRSGNLLLRQHAAHELRRTVRRARRIGLPRLLSEWREAKLQHLRYWAVAIERVMSRREQA